MSQLEWKETNVSDMPSHRGKGLREDTKKLLNSLKNNSGNIVKFSFKSDADCRRAYHRVRELKKKGRVDIDAMSRRGNDLYVKVK